MTLTEIIAPNSPEVFGANFDQHRNSVFCLDVEHGDELSWVRKSDVPEFPNPLI